MADQVTVNVADTVESVAVSITETVEQVAVTVTDGLADAPADGKSYARKNGAWAEAVAGGGGNVVISATDPGLTAAGLWIQPVGSDLTFWVEDGS